jgi:hypothetical protein
MKMTNFNNVDSSHNTFHKIKKTLVMLTIDIAICWIFIRQATNPGNQSDVDREFLRSS